MAGVQARDERFRVTETACHRDRFLADGHTLLDGRGPRPHLERQVREQMGAQGAVVRRKGGERFLQEPHACVADRESSVEQEAAERGHVAECRSRKQLGIGRAPCDVDRALERQPRSAAVPRAPLRVAETQQQVAAL